MPGIIAATQTFGTKINFHPDLHFLVTEGGVEEAGTFHKISRIDDSRLAELFAREVLASLVHKELLSQEWAERLLSWRHTGFTDYTAVDRIINHLKLTFIADRPPPPHTAYQDVLMAAEASSEYSS
jgi:hypothetical protein